MFKYSKHSLDVRAALHPDLQAIFDDLLEIFDHRLERGIRTIAEQTIYVRDGWSKTMKSEHLPFELVDGRLVSRAVDAGPWPRVEEIGPGTLEEAKERARYYYMAGLVKGIAHQHGVEIRTGCDWDGDADFNDQTFDDLMHYELAPRRPDYR